MKTIRHLSLLASTLLAVAALTVLIGCSGSGSESTADQNDTAAENVTSKGAEYTEQSDAPAVESAIQAAELVSRSDTADAAMQTYLDAVRQGKLDIALTVLHPDSPGSNALTKMMIGWDKAKEDGAPVEMAIALIAGEVDALTYEKISDDGSFAMFRFTNPKQMRTDEQGQPLPPKTWEIEAIKTPDGWRIKPPDSGLPTG